MFSYGAVRICNAVIGLHSLKLSLQSYADGYLGHINIHWADGKILSLGFVSANPSNVNASLANGSAWK